MVVAATIFAGGLAGVICDLAFFPLDTIKTRLQARRLGTTIEHGATFSRFYKGIVPGLVVSFPSAATFWMTYEKAKEVVSPIAESLHMGALGPAIAGGLTNIVVIAVRNPFELVKQQLQSGMHAGSATALGAIVSRDGWRGLYAGSWSTLVRDMPFDALQMGMYEAMKQSLMSRQGRDLSSPELGGLGMVAGGISAALTCPLDVAKTRLMTQAGSSAGDRYVGVFDALRRIATEEGISTLFSGVKHRVAWISFGGAIFFSTFEEAKRLLNARWGETNRV